MQGQFLRTKGLGELAVRDEFPDATIVRPSVMYGECDHFLYPYTSYTRRCPIIGFVYVYKGGRGIYKMPLSVSQLVCLFSTHKIKLQVQDFALGIARIATDPTMAGKTFEFVGPHCYEMSELVGFFVNNLINFYCSRSITYTGKQVVEGRSCTITIASHFLTRGFGSCQPSNDCAINCTKARMFSTTGNGSILW